MTLSALTLWRPWDQSMLQGPKDIENRSWPPPQKYIGQFIALHAGQKWDEDGERFMGEHGFVPRTGPDVPAQAVVGVARIIRVMKKGDLFDRMENSPWFFGPFGWLLEDRTPLKEPVPCRGMQGLWALPADVEAKVRAQVSMTP